MDGEPFTLQTRIKGAKLLRRLITVPIFVVSGVKQTII